MSSAADFGRSLSGTTLSNMLGLIEFVERCGKPIHPETLGQLYYDSEGSPPIGYGFDLKHPNTLGAVLDGLADSKGGRI